MGTLSRRGQRLSRAARAAALVAAISGLMALQPSGPAAAATGVPNNDPSFVQVYVNNVENLPTVGLQCPGDWQDLVAYLTLQTYHPDIFLVNQISGQEQLDDYTARLSADLGEKYSAVIAESAPAAMNSPCGAPKDHQTNAVIYRTGRFTLKSDPLSSTKRWQAQADLDGCVNNTQARTKAVKAMLHDNIANKNISVASIHWPTAASGGPPCAQSNATEATNEIHEDGYSGDLLIFGGDTNYTDRDSANAYRPWYASLNGDLGGTYGYRDAVYAGCAASGADIKTCLADNWTFTGTTRRIDYLFAKKGSGGMPEMTDSHTVTFNEGDDADLAVSGTDRTDMNYSDHRAVRVRIHY